ncbi:MAG: hypothetical protein [Bacteriophage sp.]|nr:MAG: hypothetical protein [Bacteriophage sp.]
MSNTAIVDPTRRFTVWKMSEIYTGPSGTGSFVPNVDDVVWDWDNGVYRVISVDTYNTNLSYMQRVNISSLGGGVSDTDTSIVTGPGTNSTAFRVYVDTSTTPHTLAIDSRVIWNGADNAYVKVFYGTDTSATGRIISAIVDSKGTITSTNIPLQLVISPSGVNIAQKTATIASCSETVTDGDVVTVVTYTTAGTVTSRDKFIVSNTNYIASIDQSTKYVTNIELISPFISSTDNRLIECPINMVTQSLNFSAKVSYSDGTSTTSAIDGNKWNIAGLSSYIATQIGQYIDIVLVYTLSATEYAMDATAALPDRKVTRAYRLKTVDIDTYYSVKMFAVPKWNMETSKYDLFWYLYNLERSDIIDVTNFMEYATTSPQWAGDRYGSTQNLTVAFNMQNLGPSYSYYRLVQNIAITLLKPSTNIAADSYYNIAYSNTTNYGGGVKAFFTADEANVGMIKINVSCNQTDTLSWLTKIYRNLEPLFYSMNESEAPTPTHALVIIGTGDSAWQREIMIDDVIKDIRNISGYVVQGTLVRLQLFYRDASGDHQLAVAPFVATAMS